jgi:hypothetical protein
MRVKGRAAAIAGIVAGVILATPAAGQAALAISAPSSGTLGTVPSGASSLSHQLGPVTVTATGLVFPSFVATVSSTAFTTGAGAPSQTIAPSSISYWSGPATAALVQTPTPGQIDAAHAQTLSTSRTAFSSVGLALSITTTWDPTIVIAIPAAAVAGTYSGTITHSVA